MKEPSKHRFPGNSCPEGLACPSKRHALKLWHPPTGGPPFFAASSRAAQATAPNS